MRKGCRGSNPGEVENPDMANAVRVQMFDTVSDSDRGGMKQVASGMAVVRGVKTEVARSLLLYY